MELGITIPLERFLRRPSPPYGVETDRRFCWDLHVIDLRGQKSLLAVHCHSRYTFVLFGLTPAEWTDLPNTFLEGMRQSLSAAGIGEQEINDYIACAGACDITKTHGRREVAFLNRAWEDVLRMEYALDTKCREQPFLDSGINAKPSRCVGFEGLAPAIERIRQSIGR